MKSGGDGEGLLPDFGSRTGLSARGYQESVSRHPAASQREKPLRCCVLHLWRKGDGVPVSRVATVSGIGSLLLNGTRTRIPRTPPRPRRNSKRCGHVHWRHVFTNTHVVTSINTHFHSSRLYTRASIGLGGLRRPQRCTEARGVRQVRRGGPHLDLLL